MKCDLPGHCGTVTMCAYCDIEDRKRRDKVLVENARLRAELQAAEAGLEASDRRKEVWLFRFEEARKIIEEVSHSPEFKKFYYLGQEQDPCGVHAFTKKYAQESGSYLMHQISCPFLQGGLCSCENIAVVEGRAYNVPLCYHRKDDPAHLRCGTNRTCTHPTEAGGLPATCPACEAGKPVDGAPRIAHCGGLHCGYPMSRNCICLCDECATAKKADH